MTIPSPIILASSSPRRQALLRQMGLSFLVHPSTVDENILASETPAQLVQRLAFQKANDVRKFFDRGLVLGADTIVVLENNILNKPADAADACRMLGMLSGRTHHVFTGFALISAEDDRCICDYEITAVTFRELDDEEISFYVAGGSPLDKAGAYGIQDDFGAVFIRRIDGCYNNVVGLPITKLYQTMKNFGFRISDLGKE